VWNIYRLFAEVPMEDRSYLDRPALGFRLFWPLIKTLDFYCAGLFSDSYKEKVSAKLVRAGQGYMLSASQFLAARIFSALLVCLLVGAYAALAQKPALWGVALSAALLASFYPELWLKETQQKRDKRVTKDLPFYLDVIVLAVESGTNFTGGLTQAVQKAPDGPLRFEFSRVLRDIRAGKPRAQALKDLSQRVGGASMSNVVSSIIQAEKTGSSLGATLSAQADNLRSDRFLKAEKAANEAPVKLLGPLILFIFPNTFLVIIFVLLSQALAEGILQIPWLVWAYNFPGGGSA
jgi:tight adherence protein C